MAQPTTAITRVELSATFSEFDLAASRQGFIAPRVLRPRMVGSQQADVGKIPLEALLRNRETKRVPKAGYTRDDFEFDKFEYKTEDHGVEEVLDDRQLAIYRDVLDAEMVHTARAIDAVARRYEVTVAAAVYDPTTWAGEALTTALVTPWSTLDACDPIANIEAARLKVIDGSGLVPNALVCNRRQFFCLKNCDAIVDRVKYSGIDDPKDITPQAVAAALDVDFLLVAGGIQNTANRPQEAVISQIWSDSYAMLARVATSDDPQEPCIGRTFMWSGDGPGSVGTAEEIAVLVEEYREEARRGSVIRARTDYDVVVMYPQAGHLLSNVIA